MMRWGNMMHSDRDSATLGFTHTNTMAPGHDGSMDRIARGEQGGGKVDGQQGEVSPDENDSPLDRKFIVSPMGTLDRGRT